MYSISSPSPNMSMYFTYPDPRLLIELEKTAKAMVAPGKGILVCDESASILGRRFQCINIENTEEMRRKFRQVLLTTYKTWAKYISAVVLHHETFYQQTDDGATFPDTLHHVGVLPGIKVDVGFASLDDLPDECFTKGAATLSSCSLNQQTIPSRCFSSFFEF